MNNRNLGILAVVAAVMVMWAVVQSHLSRPSRVEPSGPVYLVPGLDTGEIDSITVGHGDEAVKITKRGDGRFVVANKANYPADTKSVNELISKCLDIKRQRLYTSNAKNQEELELTEEKAHGCVKFFKVDGTLLAGVVVGKSQENGQGAFVRMAGSDDVYVSENTPWFATTPIEYLDTELVAIEPQDVNAVTVSTSEGAYTLRSLDEGRIAVMNDLPVDKTLKASDARSVLTALTGLSFEDVNAPLATDDLDFDHRYVCTLNDATQYTLRLAKAGGKTYLRCEASYTDMTPVTVKRGGNESEEELKKKEAKLLAQERVQKFTLRHKGWVYTIPDWKANYLTKKQADLLEDRPEPVQAEPGDEADPNSAAVPAVEPVLPTEQPEAVPGPNEMADPNAHEVAR